MKLTLERKDQQNKTPAFMTPGGPVLLMTPAIDEGYWRYRVKLTEKQAIVGFPKFSTIGIGFSVETDWNTNLPYTCSTEKIYNHIKHNKGNKSIRREACIDAIRLIQEAAAADRAAGLSP